MKKSQRDRLSQLPRMQKCERQGLDCKGKLTWEHTRGRKDAPDWSIVCLCWHHHLVDLNKELNRHLAYKNVSDEELRKYKLGESMIIEKNYLQNKYAVPKSTSTSR